MNADHSKYEKRENIDAYLTKIKSLQTQLTESFHLLMDEVKNILPIQGNELSIESDKNIGKYHTYLTKLAIERRQMFVFRGKRDEIEGELGDYYRFNWDKSTKLTETAIGKYVAAHPVYMAIQNLVRDQENIVSFLEGVLENIKSRGFAIKQMIEMKKIELGMN